MKNSENKKSVDSLELVITLNRIEIDKMKRKWKKEFSLNGKNVTLRESFDPNKSYYEISISKEVASLEELYQANREILEILEKIALIWPIVTGYSLRYIDIEKKILPKYQSNFDEIESNLLAKINKTKKILSLDLKYSIRNKFNKPPLELTIKIYETIKNESDTLELLKYYTYSLLDKDCWFLHLYKVREKLKEILKTRHKIEKDCDVRRKLSIPKKDWEDFGNILNNYDLRNIGKIKGTISEKDINKTKVSARKWIIAFLNQEFHLNLKP